MHSSYRYINNVYPHGDFIKMSKQNSCRYIVLITTPTKAYARQLNVMTYVINYILINIR